MDYRRRTVRVDPERLRMALQLREVSDSELARAIGISSQAINMARSGPAWTERGRHRRMARTHAAAAARYLVVPLSWLAGDDPPGSVRFGCECCGQYIRAHAARELASRDMPEKGDPTRDAGSPP